MKEKAWIFLLVGGMFLFSGCSVLPKEEVLPEAPVLLKKEQEGYEGVLVTRGNLTEKKVIECTYRANQEIAQKLEGKEKILQGIYVKVGQTVKKGDLLAELENESIKTEMAEQEEAMANARVQQRQLEEQKKIKEKKKSLLENAVKQDEKYQTALSSVETELKGIEINLWTIRETLKINQDRLRELEDALEKTRLKAEMDGTITYVRVYDENELSTGRVENNPEQNICEICDYSRAFFFAIVEEELFYQGQEVEVSVPTAGKKYDTVVTACERMGEIYSVEFELTEPDTTLNTGRGGEVELIIKEHQNVLFLPESAVQWEEDRSFVYYLDENGVRQEKDIVAGKTIAGMTIIEEGLEEGEQVVQ